MKKKKKLNIFFEIESTQNKIYFKWNSITRYRASPEPAR